MKGSSFYDPVLLVNSLYKRFGGVVALSGVSLKVRRRAITLLIGPNGSGKTTLLNTIAGVYKPDKGDIIYEGRSIKGWPPHRVYRAGIVRTFQIPAPFKKLTVLENLLVAARDPRGELPLQAIRRSNWIKQEEELAENAFRILELLQLDELWDRRAGELSGGQMKLLELGRALMSKPKVLLLDEPIAGVNPALAHRIFEHLLKVRDRLNVTMLVVEHRLDIALRYVDWIYVMNRGRVVAEGDPRGILEHPEVAKAYLGE